MNVEINWVAVMVAGLSSMAVGSIWYAKPVFGTKWAKLVGLNDARMAKGAAKALVLALVMSLLTAFVLAHVAALSRAFYGVSTMEAGLTTAFWLWLGISVTTVVTHDAFEQRPHTLTLLTIGNRLVTLMVMGAILGAFGGF